MDPNPNDAYLNYDKIGILIWRVNNNLHFASVCSHAVEDPSWYYSKMSTSDASL